MGCCNMEGTMRAGANRGSMVCVTVCVLVMTQVYWFGARQQRLIHEGALILVEQSRERISLGE